jgi:hypothetical protein
VIVLHRQKKNVAVLHLQLMNVLRHPRMNVRHHLRMNALHHPRMNVQHLWINVLVIMDQPFMLMLQTQLVEDSQIILVKLHRFL